ncbi:MAG: leucine-rich repeat protein [Dysgonamonadaceae bacterium]|jgi:hypothetical protein|nr:leucine-rich repeat protein [Dysgonamonadaceae bacterium]
MKHLSILFITLLSVATTVFGTSVTITLPSASTALTDNDFSAAVSAAGTTLEAVTGLKLESAGQDIYWNLSNCKAVAVYFDSIAAPLLATLDLSAAAFADHVIPNSAGTGTSIFGQTDSYGKTPANDTVGMAIVTVILPNDLLTVGERAFYKCLKLENINLPNGLKRLNTGAFTGCGKLQLSALPETVEVIGVSTFNNCKLISLSSLPSSLKSLSNYTFSGCSNISISKIPDQVTSIGNATFSSCTNITEMTFPAGLTSIGSSAFSSTPLTRITFLGATPPTVSSSFSNVGSIDVIVPAGAMSGASAWESSPWTSFKSVTEAQSSGLNRANISGKSISIRPNIVTSEIYLSGDNIAPIIRIYNTTGQEVLKVKLPDGSRPVIPVAQLTPGVYLLTAGDVSLKFIKK